MEVGIMLFTLLLAVAVLAFVVWNHQQRKETWAAFARENDLSADGTHVTGRVDEIAVNIYTETRGSGKNKSTFTVFEADFTGTGLPLRLHIYREGMFSKLAKVFGGEDIEIGIPGVDSSVIIKGEDVSKIRSYLTRPDVSRGLIDLVNLCDELEINPRRVKLEYRGAMSNKVRMQGILDALVKATRAVGGDGYGALKYDGEW